MLISIVACKKAAEEVMVKEEVKAPEASVEVTGDAAVDAVGSDLNNIQNVEKDLGTEDLNEIDSGLQDIENI